MEDIRKIGNIINTTSINNRTILDCIIEIIHDANFDFRRTLETERKKGNVTTEDYRIAASLLESDGLVYENPFIRKNRNAWASHYFGV